jgi:hypothetical protein
LISKSNSPDAIPLAARFELARLNKNRPRITLGTARPWLDPGQHASLKPYRSARVTGGGEFAIFAFNHFIRARFKEPPFRAFVVGFEARLRHNIPVFYAS